MYSWHSSYASGAKVKKKRVRKERNTGEKREEKHTTKNPSMTVSRIVPPSTPPIPPINVTVLVVPVLTRAAVEDTWAYGDVEESKVVVM